jgi:hypothetical protein
MSHPKTPNDSLIAIFGVNMVAVLFMWFLLKSYHFNIFIMAIG